MSYKIDEILANPLLTVEERDDERGSFAVRIGRLTAVISIELGRFHTTETTKYRISHAIHTPKQLGPYRTSRPSADSWEAALQKAVNGLTSYYKEAVDSGCQPHETWLVEN